MDRDRRGRAWRSMQRHYVDLKGEDDDPGLGLSEARQGGPPLVQALVTHLEVATVSASGTFREF